MHTTACEFLRLVPLPRGVGIDQPTLEELPMEVTDFADDTVVDKPLRVLEGGHEPVVKRDSRDRAALPCGSSHTLRTAERIRNRFLTQHVHSPLERSDRRFDMERVRPEIEQDIDLVDDGLSRCSVPFESESIDRLRERVLIPADYHVALDAGCVGEETREFRQCGRVSLSPQPVAEDPDAECHGATDGGRVVGEGVAA